MLSLLANLPRWIFLAALVFAPWAYGCTRPWTIQVLDGLLAAVVALWLAACALRRRAPRVPWPLWGSALFLALQGWEMIWNANAYYDRVMMRFEDIQPKVSFLPGVVDRVDCLPVMIRDTVLLGTLCFAADLVQRPVWRVRLWWTMALAGVSLVVCGLGMKIAGVHISSYTDASLIGWTSFAFYLYHGNAGAFINLILPLVAGLTALAFLRPNMEMQRALWMPGLLVCIAGSVATLSKGGMVIALGLLVALAVWFIRYSNSQRGFRLSGAQLGLLLGGGVIVLAAMLSLSWGQAADRWSELHGAEGEKIGALRLLVSRTCFHMMPDSGWWGFGPGNFMICFPHYTAYLGKTLYGVWIFAHEDYLQTIVEWGYVGAAFFAIIFFGGMWAGWQTLRKTPLVEGDAVLLTMSLLALAGVAVHALFDFPLQIASLQLYVAALLGLCWGSGNYTRPETPGRRRRSMAGGAVAQASAGGAP